MSDNKNMSCGRECRSRSRVECESNLVLQYRPLGASEQRQKFQGGGTTVLYNKTDTPHPALGSGASRTTAFWSACAVGAATSFCARSGKTSPKRLGKNRFRRFQVSSHRRLSPAPSSGGSRKPPFTITKRMFFKLSGTASSCSLGQNTTKWNPERELMEPFIVAHLLDCLPVRCLSSGP